MTSSFPLGADPTAALLAQALGTQYQIVRLLGRGGMGAVYLAREPFLEREVAVKVLPSDVASGDARERFLREARTAARLSHPNIVPLYTFGQAGDLLYYVMGFVDGESLEARLRHSGRLPFDDARRITTELADALEYAHQLGVVHRDVKPDNVLLDRVTGRAMLTDFGIAKQRAGLETLTQTGVIVGTPHYMSPEQAGGDRDIDGRSDIYSLGVMAYRMATGRLPFEGGTLRDVLVQHATRSPVPPTQIIPSLPLDLDTVITRALAKEPAERWPNARSMREALSPESEESVPETLRDIAGMGTRLMLLSAAIAQIAYVGSRFGFMDKVLVIVSLSAAAFVQLVGPIALIKPVRRYGWRATLERWFRQPGWWTIWWPRFARRPGDVWDRLPRDVYFTRMVNSTGLLMNVVLMNAMMYGMSQEVLTSTPGFMNAFTWVALGTMGVFFATLVPGALRFQRRAKKLGLAKSDIERVLGGPTAAPSFWSRSHIAALLTSPTAQSRRELGSTLPNDILRDVEAMARDAAPSAHADLYREAAQAAAAICAAVARAEDELGQLARDADSRERARIQASLDALGAPDANQSSAKAQMRELLERQLQLFRELESRREQVSDRRDHLHEQLRALALHLANLRAQGAADTATSADITGRIRTLCREIDYRMDGARELKALLR